MTVDLIEDLVRIDAKLKAIKGEQSEAVIARGSTLMDVFGVGPAGAARILADVGDVARFADRNRFASWTGTAPLDASSGEQTRHRLSRAGNRRLNHVLYMAAVVQIRHDTEGRTYYLRKRSEGKKPLEALRCLKRRISDVVYRQLLADAHTAAATAATQPASDDLHDTQVQTLTLEQQAPEAGLTTTDDIDDIDDIDGPLINEAVLAVDDVVGAGPGGQCGATQKSSATDLPPRIGTSEQPLHGPAKPTLQPDAIEIDQPGINLL